RSMQSAMSDLRHPRPPAPAPGARAGYQAQLLREARVGVEGLLHRVAGAERRLAWAEIWFAVAAEIGEPEGGRTIVFDLVVGRDERGWQALRLDAEPGPFAGGAPPPIHPRGPRAPRGPPIRSPA